MARERGADLVLDASGPSIGQTPVPMVIHLEGIPDWTASVIQALNDPAGAGKSGQVEGRKDSVSAAGLRFATIDISRVFSDTRSGAAMTKAVTRMREELKALSRYGTEYYGREYEIKEREVRTQSDQMWTGLLEKIEKTLRANGPGGRYNVIFDSSGNSTHGIPVAVLHENIPDVTDEVIKTLGAAGPP